jgi:hypothetical protein
MHVSRNSWIPSTDPLAYQAPMQIESDASKEDNLQNSKVETNPMPAALTADKLANQVMQTKTTAPRQISKPVTTDFRKIFLKPELRKEFDKFLRYIFLQLGRVVN